MDIKYAKTKETPAVVLTVEDIELTLTGPAGEYEKNLTDIALFSGEKYTVQYNEQEYSCTAWTEGKKVHIGGKSEPFDVYSLENDLWAKADTPAKVITIHHEGGVKLDGRFLSESIFKIRFTLDTTTYELTADKTPVEVIRAFNEKKEIKANVYIPDGSLIMSNLAYSQSLGTVDDLFFYGYNIDSLYNDTEITINNINFAIILANYATNKWQIATTQIPTST